ncbi:MAG: response regulator transcription factor [Blautia sp.]|nr:response regulator transcription factor [Blautia sp.]
MNSKLKVLICDDDPVVTDLISMYMTSEGYDTRIVTNGKDCLTVYPSFQPDLIMLDLMLPGPDGFQILREIRNTSPIPIIMLSSKGEAFEKVLALELGADDYIIKPFDAKELLARTRAVLRRHQSPPALTGEGDQSVSYPDLIINMTNYTVLFQGKPVDLPPREIELLFFLATSPNQVFTREQLLNHIWGYDYIGDSRTVDVHIKRIREKLYSNAYWALTTVWGIGYKFEVKKA